MVHAPGATATDIYLWTIGGGISPCARKPLLSLFLPTHGEKVGARTSVLPLKKTPPSLVADQFLFPAEGEWNRSGSFVSVSLL